MYLSKKTREEESAMNLVLGANEKEVKNWNYVDRDNNLEFDNDIVVTDKRFIYQRKLKQTGMQNSISRYELPLENIKSVNSFYGFKQSFFWLILGIVGVLVSVISLEAMISAIKLHNAMAGFGVATQSNGPNIAGPIFFILLGIVLGAIGFYLHFNPDKSPLKVKKPVFSISIETKTVDGGRFVLGAGNTFALRNKPAFDLKTIILFIPPICIFGIPYYLMKKANKSCRLDIPEEYACEILDTIGSVIF